MKVFRNMKKSLLLLFLLLIFLSACAAPEDQLDGRTIEDILHEYQKPGEGEAAIPDEPISGPLPISGPDCYQDGEHPVGLGIAEQFSEITTYDEVMTWFCNGAIFEDILNALATEELTSVDADGSLQLIAAGLTWDEVWLELGLTEE
jgi:hypothetical protein